MDKTLMNNSKYSLSSPRECSSSHCGAAVTKLTTTHEDLCTIPGLAEWLKDLVLPDHMLRVWS